MGFFNNLSKHQQMYIYIKLVEGYLIFIAAFASQAVFYLSSIRWLSSSIDVSSSLFSCLFIFDTPHIKFSGFEEDH